MKNTLLALVMGFCGTIYAQTDYTFVYDGQTFISDGIKLYDDGKYADAIKQFDKVVKNDPKFYTAQYEKALALSAGEDKEAAKTFFENAFAQGYMAELPDFYMAYGNFLSDQKDYEKSEKMFLEAQKIYPNNSVVLYNLALLYVRKDERQKSVDLFEKAITINPNHAGSHYLLGLMALEDGRVTEGTMALLAYLTLVHEGKGTENAILKLDAKFAENYLEKSKLVFSSTGGDNFEEIDVILRNSLPLKSAYKINSAFEDVAIRQVQAVVEYAAEHKMGNGFFERTYVPWLADIVKKKQFEGFSYYILLGMEEKLGKKLKSQTKKIISFKEQYIDKDFWDVFARRTVDIFGKQEEVVVYLQDGKPYLLGKEVNGKSEGKYKLLYADGNLRGELNFVNNELDGHQKYFDTKGRLIEEKMFVAGKLDGKRTTYYENGNIEIVESYKNDVLDGISTSYYINGGKNCEGNFVNNERNGTLTCYYENGVKRNEINYDNGKLNGKYLLFDKTGAVTNDLSYTLDKRDGKATEYYNGKVVKSEVEYKAGLVSSSYKSYFANGTVKEETVYVNDKPKSAVFNYANGKKSYESVYDKDGYVTGYNYYNNSSEKFFEETYKDGVIKSGLQYENGKPKPVEVPVSKTAYIMKTLDGTIVTNGEYKKGKKNGDWNYFYESGVIHIKDKYNNGLQEGLIYTYDPDARVSTVVNFVKDTIAGLYENYGNGRLSSVYHYRGGEINGPAKSFFPDGTVSSESFFKNGELNSKLYNYWQNGNPRLVTKYVEDTPVLMEIYTPDGKKEGEIDYTNKNGKVVLPFYNGSEIHEYTMTNGLLNGKYTVKDKAGKLRIECDYISGTRNGKYINNGPTGAPRIEINYYAGKITGTSKYYDIVGNLRLTSDYILGNNTGLETRYFSTKGKLSEFNQYDGKTEGELKYYNLKGEVILILGYNNNDLVYYIKPGKDGKFTDKVPVISKTAQIVATYPNGKNAIEINYLKGKLNGKMMVSSQEGKPEYEAMYDMGLLNGSRIEYYPNGKIYKKENLKNSYFEGLQEFFKEDGKLWLTAEYKNDEMHGLCKIYTNGTITQTQRYDSDEFIEVLK